MINKLVKATVVAATLFVPKLSYSQTPAVQVQAYGQHIGQNIVYQYQITNNIGQPLSAIEIGRFSDIGDSGASTTVDKLELSVFPVGFSIRHRFLTPSTGYIATSGWTGRVAFQEETNLHSFEFEDTQGIRSSQSAFAQGATRVFSIIVPKQDQSYLSGHFRASFGSGPPWNFGAPIQLIDVTPPQVSVKLGPSILWPANNKPAPIVATVTVRDDYDPAPEVRLESITCSETLAVDDVVGADAGKDDRQFSLKARRAGTDMSGRTYTVTYSATDASGNTARATAVVSVPHDQDK
jgi:hypothetical protein